ncbi:hypothetical protein AOC36_03470 [Erysipelothrix larvae]|uniref:DUF3137 domain-containing protein n=1 Tax=Erysipelothrix larvae TaxID=1514105 RepID=A0A0X8GZ26_9FIRM|nr:DUF3137 domain-containing protein [Erysipelothrix larvae]AMC93068.1 hypothetical protein AOC36_03470 [Erysipelothrix larvae]
MVEIQKRMRILFAVFVCIVIFLMGSMFRNFDSIVSSFVMTFILFIGFAILWTMMSKQLTRLYRERIIRVALEETFDHFVYEPEQGFSKQTIYDTNLFPKGNTYTSSDLVRLQLNGNTIEIADVKIEDVTTDDNGTHVSTYFTGKWMMMKSKKPIESKLYIIDRDNRNSRPKGWLFKGKELEKVSMESIAFNKQFTVYASNPHDAFYVLTPQVIQGVINLDDHNLSVYQDKDKTHVAASGSKPFVNVTIFSNLDEINERNRVKQQFETILEFIKFYGIESEGES